MYLLYKIIPNISFVAHYLDMILLCWTFATNAFLDIDINIHLLQDRDLDMKLCTPFVGPYGKMMNRFQHSKDNTGTTDMQVSSLSVTIFYLHRH